MFSLGFRGTRTSRETSPVSYLQHPALMDTAIFLVRFLGLSFIAFQFLARGYINIRHSLAARAV
jgi:hypothetical protein